jgi:hypothetical protein
MTNLARKVSALCLSVLLAASTLAGQQGEGPPVDVPFFDIGSARWNQALPMTDAGDNSRLDLIAGRLTVFTLPVAALGFHPGETVQFELQFGPAAHVKSYEAITLRSGAVVELIFRTPDIAGAQAVRLTATAARVMSPQVLVDTVVDLIRTRDIPLAFYPLAYTGALQSTDETITRGLEHLSAVYPIADGRIRRRQMQPVTVPPSSFFRLAASIPQVPAAIIWLWLENVYAGVAAGERVVGIVPQNWFVAETGESALGLVYHSIPTVAIVQDGHPVTLSHELGHTYRQCDGYTLDSGGNIIDAGPAASADGLWITDNPPASRPIAQALDYMGTDPGELGVRPFATFAAERWSLDFRFRDLLDEFRSATPLPHPAGLLGQCTSPFTRLSAAHASPSGPPARGPAVLVTGFLSRNGGTELAAVHRTEAVATDDADRGDVRVTLLDRASLPLDGRRFVADFTVLDSSAEADIVPFAVAIPDHAEAVAIEIARSGQPTVHTSLAGQLLRDAIVALPDEAFSRAKRRDALLSTLSALESQLRAAAPGAGQKLEQELRRHVEALVNDTYPRSSAIQLSKTALLALVDDMVRRLR